MSKKDRETSMNDLSDEERRAGMPREYALFDRIHDFARQFPWTLGERSLSESTFVEVTCKCERQCWHKKYLRSVYLKVIACDGWLPEQDRPSGDTGLVHVRVNRPALLSADPTRPKVFRPTSAQMLVVEAYTPLIQACRELYAKEVYYEGTVTPEDRFHSMLQGFTPAKAER